MGGRLQELMVSQILDTPVARSPTRRVMSVEEGEEESNEGREEPVPSG